ncbi:MAG: PD-(D/E)XK nuclease family protein, partial [Bacteroidota bacterium]
LKQDELFNLIFRKVDGIVEVVNYFHELFRALIDAFPEGDNSFRMEKEYIFHIRTRLNKLHNLLGEEDIGLSMDSFIRLFRKVLSDFRIPFEGEPLQGIQIMGILESRLLDFKNLVFLSMNEGVMPATGKEFSYIPANLRYAFGMPVREDKDAIYAYYFYRLLNRANNVNILYNSKTEGVRSGEPTRYIHQLRYLGKEKVREFTKSFSILDKETVKISVEKDAGVMEVLRKYTDPELRDYLSPSALLAYLDCPLRFYFSYVAGIKEEEEVSEEIDASGFGSLYHKTMELIYQGMKNKKIHPEDFRELMQDQNIKNQLDQAFREEFLKISDRKIEVKPEGKNIIIYEIINKLVRQTLEIDKSNAPFIFHDTEQKIDNMALEAENAGNVHLGGLIDRMDYRNGVLHVIDYKTGKVDLAFPSLEKLFDRDSWGNSDYFKGVFQIFMYSWLYLKEHPGENSITPAIYQTRELFKRDFSIYLRDKSAKKEIMNFRDYVTEFEDYLKQLVSDIFNPGITFFQTEDEQRCTYCLYKEICHRQ